MNANYALGPHRVLPGRLSVSRTFGDIEAKLPFYGGIPGVIIAEPDIRQFKVVRGEHDFILMGCDGIFDKLANREIIDLIWGDVDKSIAALEDDNKS